MPRSSTGRRRRRVSRCAGGLGVGDCSGLSRYHPRIPWYRGVFLPIPRTRCCFSNLTPGRAARGLESASGSRGVSTPPPTLPSSAYDGFAERPPALAARGPAAPAGRPRSDARGSPRRARAAARAPGPAGRPGRPVEDPAGGVEGEPAPDEPRLHAGPPAPVILRGRLPRLSPGKAAGIISAETPPLSAEAPLHGDRPPQMRGADALAVWTVAASSIPMGWLGTANIGGPA